MPTTSESKQPANRPASTRSAFIALIGRPNVGKSSLLNAMVGRKVAIVSDKPQTTRNRIMGVLTKGETQLVFLDTPGAHRPRTRLGDFMVKSISEAVSGVDAAVLVAEPTLGAVKEEERNLLAQCRKSRLPVVLVINKTDTLAEKSRLLPVMEKWRQEYDFAAILPVSALTGDGVDDVVRELSQFTFESPHFFPDDMVSDQPERVVAAELIREKMLCLLRDEIPHGVAVVIENARERETEHGPILDLDAYIYCEKESHKGIIIGKRGAMLKEIGSQARQEMESLFGAKVNLQCWVKVKEDWRNRQGLLGSFGYKL
ncbi:MAG TPA: GTPase Era [Firmicutes bacterium]|nr:GTPase Era [Bacillota bacterium]